MLEVASGLRLDAYRRPGDYTGGPFVPVTAGPPRLAAVDAFRGATMAAMVVVNTPGDWSHVYAPLLHAEWHGWTPTDLVFPFFVFIVGVAIVLSPRSTASIAVILRRAALLFALGLLLALYPRFDFTTVRIMGVLQRLALSYLGAALIFRAVAGLTSDRLTRGAVVLAAAVGLAALYWAVLMLVAPPGGVAGDLTPTGNIGAWIDRAVLGEAHLWRQSKTWDPEGLLSTVPAIATALSGVAAGLLVTSPHPRRIALLAAAGVVFAAAGLVCDRWLPINKNLWTSPYVLFTSGLAAVALALCLLIERRARRVLQPFVVLGVNALALFVISGLLVKTLVLVRVDAGGQPSTLYRWLYVTIFAPVAPPKLASLLFACAALAGLYALLAWLYRRRIFLRV
jgi:predicted acyltransferase